MTSRRPRPGPSIATDGLCSRRRASTRTDRSPCRRTRSRCSYAIAAATLLDLTDRQHLLDAATVDDRLSLAIELLRRETTMVDRMSLRAGDELARGSVLRGEPIAPSPFATCAAAAGTPSRRPWLSSA